MDKIYLNRLAFYGYHGAFPEENKLGQRFIVDLILELDIKAAAKTDDLSKTVNYGEVYNEVKEIVEGPSKKLVETVAENIAAVILDKFNQVVNCTIKVEKPDPPIPGHYHSVAVEIKRNRNDA